MFRRAVDRVSWVLSWVANICFIAMVALVVISVCLRPLHIATPWSDEGACWLFIWTVFLSAAIALKRNQHIRIDVVLVKLSVRSQKAFMWFLDLLCLPFCLGLIYGAYQMMVASYHMRSPALEIPLIYYYLPLLIGFFMMAVYLTLSIFDFARGGSVDGREN